MIKGNLLLVKIGVESVLVWAMGILPCWLYAQSSVNPLKHANKIGYLITGKLPGLVEGEKVTMLLSGSKSYHSFYDYFTAEDSGYVKDGKFALSGVVPDGPRRYWMIFDRHYGIKGKAIDICIDNGEQIEISSDSSIEKIPHNYIQHYVSIKGSLTNYSRMCLEPARVLYDQNMLILKAAAHKLRDSIGFDGQSFEGLFTARECLNRDLYENILSNFAGRDPEVNKMNMVFLTEFENSGHAAFWMDLYKNTNSVNRNSFYGQWLKDVSILSVGQPFPEFSLPNTDGQIVSLSTVVNASKVTIVHFWSVKSGDMLQDERDLHMYNEKYHDKGLNIIGLFHDDSYLIQGKHPTIDAKQQWVDLLRSKKYPWYNVADLKGKEGLVEKTYREAGNSLTTNVIIDSNGKIVAWDVKGVDLQYYLWKMFKE